MPDRAKTRTAREEPLLREVRSRLSREGELPARLRRIERMEHAARIWVNGRELGNQRRNGYPYDVKD